MYSWLTNILANTSLKDIVTLQVPPHKRQLMRLALLHTFISPLIEIYNEFKSYRNNALYELNFDGSTIHFEHFLNEKFNQGGTGIVIETIGTSNQVFIENKNYGADKVFIKSKGTTGDSVFVGTKAYYESFTDFIVKVPAALYVTLNLDEMKAYIDKYRLPGRIYEIQSL